MEDRGLVCTNKEIMLSIHQCRDDKTAPIPTNKDLGGIVNRSARLWYLHRSGYFKVDGVVKLTQAYILSILKKEIYVQQGPLPVKHIWYRRVDIINVLLVDDCKGSKDYYDNRAIDKHRRHRSVMNIHK